jgi:cyclohexanone monooxygenase
VTGPTRCQVAIIGAGISGMGLGIRLKQAGMHDFLILERSDGVGGTWRANRYPGAACDVPSHLYSFSFELNPRWSSSYAGQPEILAYLEHCADKYRIRPHLRCNTAVTGASWDEARGLWCVRTSAGQEIEAQILVSGLGMFSVPHTPQIQGLDDFAGRLFHTAQWPADASLAGQRVGVIGTGASAIQIVPAIAADAASVSVFQRTPPYIVPRMNTIFSEQEKEQFAQPGVARKNRWDLYQAYEKRTQFRSGNPLGQQVTQYALGHLQHVVTDPDLQAKLTPHYSIGCKRILVSSDYYPALLRENVELVTEGINRVNAQGVVSDDGAEHPLDVLVLATGFRASDYLVNLDLTGRGGRHITETWRDGAHAYLGMTVTGFPNLFLMYGPNTNQGGNSLVFILEAQAAYIVRAMQWMRRHRKNVLEVKQSALDDYQSMLASALVGTVWTEPDCSSYFQNAQGKVVTQLPQKSFWYWKQTRFFRGRDYVASRVEIPGS